jgi:hypothetical protein
MLLFSVFSDNAPTTYVGASQSIVDHFGIEDDKDKIVVQIFLKDYEPMANPITGIYIASKEFPRQLIF